MSEFSETTHSFLKVSDGHSLAVYQYGNPDGIPVVFLHGGPGGGITPGDTEFFDPDKFRVILFDQRGCGRSTPFASLEDNDTWKLIEDIEAIRKAMGIEAWYIFGGSWGSTLALSYGISHPERCLGFVLRGIFLGTESEINFFYDSGTRQHFPDEHELFIAPIGPSQGKEVIEKYFQLLTSSDNEVMTEAARVWSLWEARVAKLKTDRAQLEAVVTDEFAIAFARIECHFFRNLCFFDSPNWILDNVERISHLPCFIAHGRYDAICAPEVAWKLHKAWPGSRLSLADSAGHSSKEPELFGLLKAEMTRIAENYSRNSK